MSAEVAQTESDGAPVEPYREWAIHRESGVQHIVPHRWSGKTECGTYVNKMKIVESSWPLAERDLERNHDMCERCRAASDEAKLEAGYEELHGGGD